MHVPFVCTNNTLGNIDYGIPIIASKSTDYRTSTRLFHRLIPNKPQEFDCRVKAKIKPELLQTDVTIKDENIKSLYLLEYQKKYPEHVKYMRRPPFLLSMNYMRNVEERVFRNPPPPKPPTVSEMKDSYVGRYVKFDSREVFPPEPYSHCTIQAFGRDEQPAIRPEEKGYWKLMDPYLTTNRLTHVPFTKDQQDGIARKDIVTFYDAANLPKAKGFGPRNGPASEALIIRRTVPMCNKTPFKLHPRSKSIRVLPKRLEHFGKVSETKAKYVPHTFSDLYPYLDQHGVEFPDSLAKASAWQDLAPPGMFCTEYCHMGTGWPVNAVIDYGQKKALVHEKCYSKLCDFGLSSL